MAAMPQLGQLVKIKRGKEAGNLAVIVGIVDHKTVLLADGARRTGTDPKRKNIAHITLLDHIDQSVALEIEQKGHVQNAKLRFCLNRYVQT
ncbi:MAG: KOW motif-containing protein [Tumebacillaceae bacterium]